jgi:hypothetical protein
LIDIRESIENIYGFLEEMDFDAYHTDLKTRSAVERQLQSFRRPLLGSRTMESGFALGLTGKGCVEWETF